MCFAVASWYRGTIIISRAFSQKCVCFHQSWRRESSNTVGNNGIHRRAFVVEKRGAPVLPRDSVSFRYLWRWLPPLVRRGWFALASGRRKFNFSWYAHLVSPELSKYPDWIRLSPADTYRIKTYWTLPLPRVFELYDSSESCRNNLAPCTHCVPAMFATGSYARNSRQFRNERFDDSSWISWIYDDTSFRNLNDPFRPVPP